MDIRLSIVLMFKERNDMSRLDKFLTHVPIPVKVLLIATKDTGCGGREPGLECQLGLKTVRYKIRGPLSEPHSLPLQCDYYHSYFT